MRNAALLVTMVLMLASCAPRQASLARVSLDMSKDQVIEQIGEPNAVRGAIRNRFGQVVEVWEYQLYQYAGAIRGLSPYHRTYWLYFVDGVLAQWGEAGDWEREADRIYEVRIR